MNKQIFSIAIALPTLLLTATPSLANTTPKNQIRVNPSKPNVSQSIGQVNRIIDGQQITPRLPDLEDIRKRPSCFWIFCDPSSEEQIRNPRNLPKKIDVPQKVQVSIPKKQLH